MFIMCRHTSYTLTELENIPPFEKYLYLDMTLDAIEKQKQKQG